MDHSTKLAEFTELLTSEIETGLREIADIKWETHTALVVRCADLADMTLAAN
ncbi:hypothetical protein OAG68_02485 [bacterium]|nr:hypothetical protein [bacterium]